VEERPLDGLTFVITGTLPRPRKEIEELILKLGGRVASSISKNTDYLLVGEEPGSKLQRARELGVRTIDYDRFMKLVARNP